MNRMPLVSVVVPVFNGAHVVADAIDSVLAQTLGDFELIVVDDGSTDDTFAILRDYAERDERVAGLSQANQGLPAARNAGIGSARGEFVAFLDADDVWLPHKLERQVAYLASRPGCEACFTYIDEVDERLAPVRPWFGDLQHSYGHGSVDAALLVEKGNVVAGSGSGVLARTAAVRAVGGFDPRLVACEDLDLWYRLALRAPLEAVPEVLVHIRRSRGQMQSDYGRVLLGRIAFLANVQRAGDEWHREQAADLERRLRLQLLRRSVRRGELRRGGRQALALLASGRVS